MALLDNVFKQRMVGALVLIALAVIFLPMLFTRQDESHPVQVDAPAAPQAPAGQQVQVEPVTVPEPQALPQEPVPDEDDVAVSNQPPSMPIAPAPAPAAQAPAATAPPAVKPAPAPKSAPAPATPAAPTAPSAPAVAKAGPSGVDANGLSVSWSVQLASMSNRANADNLQKTLRTQGYNAYIRTADGVNRVFVGPLIERAEADRLRDQLDKQQKLKGIVVRFQPEKG
ncbi:SPOR domain-containing protein [Pseudomonas alliivorans]|uniref:SPOR domain-containing protein n=1 Tax=Pseudomonas alliivorans TaxID=2810613 RepID=A0ABS4C0L3_9PSED|nr:SPOR domain-containing protein [Pseudomonas alliivorans]MBP0944158.1 SPOR domain-containing protein [Pseudomonas alliivorans]MEE4325550.1 SPOR domain-containing protein [Pseudomonas alliivorans]MEE4332174.1 SPOR domain-containing protein [Pseudomonas alliivorans]MEE4367080.1 SPOR domain-containing protein [Pseudomonas alliivorans]MEE4668757.1 SPOR domain-containing protein [Pseudomonas alliivorans]